MTETLEITINESLLEDIVYGLMALGVFLIGASAGVVMLARELVYGSSVCADGLGIASSNCAGEIDAIASGLITNFAVLGFLAILGAIAVVVAKPVISE